VTRVPRPALTETGTALRRQFPAWTISHDPVRSVWCAEKRADSAIRVICDHRAAVLAIKLTAAEFGQ
jgi:hypothetical protein